jgi:2'-5' RNA ligase
VVSPEVVSHDRPRVVTLRLDRDTQQRLDALRTSLFPAGRTRVGAHVTLFHAVPEPRHEDLLDACRVACARAPFRVVLGTPYSLGRGVALPVEAAQLPQVHATLRRALEASLTRQDAQPFRPHVTVQNKVTADVARTTLADLTASHAAVEAQALALDVWAYDDRPWEHLVTVPFEPG